MVKCVLSTLCAVLMFLALGPGGGTARAEDAAEGRRQYRRGEELVKQERYREAIDAFEEGFKAAPRVGFLLNIGNCYRKVGELGKARDHYRRFLDAAPPRHPARPEVVEYLRMIEEIAKDGVPLAADGGASGAAAGPVRAERARLEASPVEPNPWDDGPLGLREQAPRAAEAPPPYARWWVWTAVGVAVAATTGALLLSRGAGEGCSASLGCFRE